MAAVKPAPVKPSVSISDFQKLDVRVGTIRTVEEVPDSAKLVRLTHVDVGDGWLIFGLPPSEVAVHPSDKNDVHELYLMCEDVEAFVQAMAKHDLSCSAVQDQGWGRLTQLRLPGGGKLGVYEPRHARPKPMAGTKKAPARSRKRAGTRSRNSR
jgi:hypothetical protein